MAGFEPAIFLVSLTMRPFVGRTYGRWRFKTSDDRDDIWILQRRQANLLSDLDILNAAFGAATPRQTIGVTAS